MNTDKEKAFKWYAEGFDDASSECEDETELREYFEKIYGNQFDSNGQEINK